MLVSSPVREREERKREEVFPYLFYFTCHSFHTCLLVHHHNVSSSPTGSAGCPTRVARLIGIYRPGQEAIRRASSGLGKAEEGVLRIPMADLGSRLPSGQCHCSKRMVGARDKLHISTGPCRIIADECSHQKGRLVNRGAGGLYSSNAMPIHQSRAISSGLCSWSAQSARRLRGGTHCPTATHPLFSLDAALPQVVRPSV